MSASRAPIVGAVDSHKSFGYVQASSGVSAELQSGQVLGLIGDNGAGKITLGKEPVIRWNLLDFERYDAGISAEVCWGCSSAGTVGEAVQARHL